VNELNESGAFIQKFQRNYNPAGVACEAVAAGRSRSTACALISPKGSPPQNAQSDPIVKA